MPDYSKSKIYAIRSYQTEKIYLGSTIQSLSERLRKHKYNYESYKNNGYHYVTSFEILNYDDHYIELVKLCPCDTIEELHKIEGYEIRNSDYCVNKNVPARTRKEYLEDNKDEIKEKCKNYRTENKDKISDAFKNYYYENQEHRINNSKAYYENNKEKIREKQKKRIICPDCGKEYTKQDIAKHTITKFHQKSLNKNVI